MFVAVVSVVHWNLPRCLLRSRRKIRTAVDGPWTFKSVSCWDCPGGELPQKLELRRIEVGTEAPRNCASLVVTSALLVVTRSY